MRYKELNIDDILEIKKNNLPLSKEDIDFIVLSYNMGKINDAKIMDFMRLIQVDNFSYEETYYLADALARTGEMWDLSSKQGLVVDKISIGSFSDATTLIFMSILASLGVKNIKLLSKKYGNFNNSLDRFNLFKGFNAKISEAEFLNKLNELSAGLYEDENKIAPADARIYALSKKYGITSIPLTAASILARRFAMGANVLVFDVKTGEGAMFESEEYATTLGKYLVETAKLAGVNAVSLITNLDEPLGSSIGVRAEVEEVLMSLRSDKSIYGSKLLEVARELVIVALMTAGVTDSRLMAGKMFDEAIESGKALDKFKEIITSYGGEYLDFKHTPDKLLDGVTVSYICAKEDGYVNNIIISNIINSYVKLSSGGNRKKDENAGIVLLVSEGDKIEKQTKLARVFYNIDNTKFTQTISDIRNSIKINQTKPQTTRTVYKVIV